MKVAIGLGLAIALMAAGQAPTAQDVLLSRLAVELAAERDVTPISVDADGSGLHGWAYDRFLQAYLAAHSAKLKGTPFDPLKPPASMATRTLVIVALPLVCADRTVRPLDVDIDDRGRPVMKWLPATGASTKIVLPDATVPAGAIAVQFADPALRQGEAVRISYAGSICSGASKDVTLPVSATSARALERPALEMAPNEQAPPGPVTLNIAGLVDLDGRLRYATAPEASTPVGAAALAAALKMRFEPARINMSPTPWASGVVVTFGVSTAPVTPKESSTPDAPMLAASSKCATSEDATYGVTGSNAIRIGGGADGAAREQQYLTALRGPAGQGLNYQSTGHVMMAGRGGTLLDGFEVRYTGLAQPLRIYFDTSREAPPLMAPKGFLCAAPIGGKSY